MNAEFCTKQLGSVHAHRAPVCTNTRTHTHTLLLPACLPHRTPQLQQRAHTCTVLSLCAMTSTVRPFIVRSSASCDVSRTNT